MAFRIPQLLYRDRLPAPKELGEGALLIHDRNVKTPGIAQFRVRCPVKAGEGLKDLAGFPSQMSQILKLATRLESARPKIVALGGGSVGDFAGFTASVLKRGVGLVQIPSTWLAAIDSAHGGKTALNVLGVKNQIGTFYPAEKIYLVRSVLLSQPETRAIEAFPELAKIALIDGRAWTRSLTLSKETGGALIWKFLPQAIESKYRVVRRDPLEQKGIRHVLNLGHTLGHVLEAVHGLPHGTAIGQGMLFSIEWSFQRGLLTSARRDELIRWLSDRFGIVRLRLPRIASRRFVDVLVQDKKRVGRGQIRFVFVRRMGKTPIESVTPGEILKEAIRQGWAK